ncbi:hypothetical protein DXG01_017045, partial [Tephrocybe rancida]
IKGQRAVSPNFSWTGEAELLALGKELWFRIRKLDVAPEEEDIPSFILGVTELWEATEAEERMRKESEKAAKPSAVRGRAVMESAPRAGAPRGARKIVPGPPLDETEDKAKKGTGKASAVASSNT